MEPIILLPIALAVAWAATRKKKTKKTVTTSATTPTTSNPTPVIDGPGGVEPWRPGGPQSPKPASTGPVGPKPWPGPGEGPKPPEAGDPTPVEIFPGTTVAQIQEHENSAYGFFVSSDCETVFVGEYWLEEVFLPKARELVFGDPEAFHHPIAIIYELLVGPQLDPQVLETGTQLCIAAWSEFAYGDVTPLGTFSGWIDDDTGDYWDYYEWFSTEYADLDAALWQISSALWQTPELSDVFYQDWPDDVPPITGDVDFDAAE